MGAPAVGTVVDGYRFKGGNHRDRANWEQAGPVDVSAQWGAGARQLPNGSIERVGPRGGVTQIGTASGDDTVGKLTEGQGKSMLYGGMMRGAERDYQQARQDGYNPAGLRNQIANIAGAVPFDGDFFGRLIRDPVSDRGNQAERRWAEGNLRQLTGAAATDPEVSRVAAINFDRGNDELAAQRYRTRAETYQGTRYAAGPGSSLLGDYPEMRGNAGETKANGLPTYPNIEAMAANITDLPGDPGSGGMGGGPRPGDVRVSQQPLAAADTPESLRAQGYVYDAARDTWSRSRREQVPTNTPTGAVTQRGRMNPIMRGLDAGVRGAADMLSFGFADELAAGADAAFGRGRGNTFGERFNSNVATQRAVDNSDGRDARAARMTGQGLGIAAGLGTGALASGRLIPEALRFAPGQTLRNAGRAGLFGGAASFTQGAGTAQGDLGDRFSAGARQAPIGAVAGSALSPVAAAAAPAIRSAGLFGGRMVGRAINALGANGDDLIRRTTSDPLQSGMRKFAARNPSANAADEAARFRADGFNPSFIDAIDDGGRGIMRANATRQTPARQAARDFADNRATDLQDRISFQARRNVSGDPRSPLQMRDEITSRRSQEADRAFGAVRNEMVTPEREIIEALRAPATRSAIEEATTASLNRGDGQTANMLQQLVDGALDNPNGVQITVGMADRIARSLNGRAEGFQRAGNNDAASSFFSLAERLRGTARQQVPGYDEALRGFAQDSRLSSATELGEQFLTMEADEFSAAVARLAPEERQVAQAAARRAIERSAGAQGNAPGVAQRLSGGREQGMRSAALLDDPTGLQRSMGVERDALMNARGINPMQGSPTSANAQDAMNAGGLLQTAGDLATGNAPSIVRRIAAQIQSRGFSDAEAEAVVMAALNPNRTDELIAMLSQRMPPVEAQRIVSFVRSSATANTGRSNAPQ